MKETYRFHSVVPSPLPRVVPKSGITIGGRYFPEGVRSPHSLDEPDHNSGNFRLF